MTPIVVSVGPLAAASANNIALSQTPTVGALTLNGALATGGIATLDVPRRVLITTTGNESSRTFTITGTDWANSPISETITGPNATTGQSVLDYKTVTSITISGNAANALTVGTSGVASSPWVRFNDFAPSNIAFQCTVTGTVNYTVQTSMDDPNKAVRSVVPALMTWVSSLDTNVVAATTTQQSNFLFQPIFVRVTLNSGTGSVVSTFLQSSNGPR